MGIKTKNMKLIIIAFAITILSSCIKRKGGLESTVQTESGITLVGKYKILESGMKYIIYREVDGGLFIINITKDSLETEFIRKQLNKRYGANIPPCVGNVGKI